MRKMILGMVTLTIALSMVGCETNQVIDTESSMSTIKNEPTDYIKPTEHIEPTVNMDIAAESVENYFVNLNEDGFKNHFITARLNTETDPFISNIVFNDAIEPVFKSSNTIIQTGDYFEILDGGDGFYVKKYFLADNQGNVIYGFEFSDESDREFVYMDSGDGYLATLHENSDFSNIDYRVSIYDPTGELIKEFSFSDKVIGDYYGSGVFRFTTDSTNYGYENEEHLDFFYNVETDSIFYGEPSTNFVDGKALKYDYYLRGFYNTDGTFCALDSSVDLQSISGNGKTTYEFPEPDYTSSYALLYDGIGIARDDVGKCYLFNLENQKLYSLNEIDEGWCSTDIYVKNGYVECPVKGADRGTYITIYDYEGNCVLKPEDSLKDYTFESFADDKAFFTKYISDTDIDLQVYDLIKHEFIDAAKYGKVIPLSDFTSDVALAKTYHNADEHWFYTIIDRDCSPILEYDKVNSYTSSDDNYQKVRGDYQSYMEINLNNVKDAGPLNANLVWSPSEDAVNASEYAASYEQSPNVSEDSETQEIYNNVKINTVG